VPHAQAYEAHIKGALKAQQDKENVTMKGMREPAERPFAGLKCMFRIIQTSMIRWRLLNKNREQMIPHSSSIELVANYFITFDCVLQEEAMSQISLEESISHF
jgi:hypothetical protein